MWDINLKLLASTVAEISRDPKYLDAPLAQTHANFGAKSCFGKLPGTPLTQVVVGRAFRPR